MKQLYDEKPNQIVSFSGGKDSTAMLLRMVELNESIGSIYFYDTGIELPEMYLHIKQIEQRIQKPITIMPPKTTWDYWFYGEFTKGKYQGEIRGFPRTVYRGCWAMRELKQRHYKNINKLEGIKCVGIAANETWRTNNKEYGKDHRFPLVEWGWTEKDVIKYLISVDAYTDLYKKFKRTGCWLCPKQSLGSLRSLWKFYPDLWVKLKQYEADSPHGFQPDKELNNLEKRFEYEDRQTILPL